VVSAPRLSAPRCDDTPVGGHGFKPGVVSLLLRLVLEAGVSLRGAPRVLAVVSEALGALGLGLEGLEVPDWTTVRLWLLRVGHATLTGPPPPPRSGGWAWLIDHSVQTGRDKCLVILGIPLADLPERGRCLRHEDMDLIALVPERSWTRAEVDQALERAVERTGVVPRAIVDDHAVDLAGGVALFRQRHPDTVEVYDTKHKAACLLRSRLDKDPRWQEFQARVGLARAAVQQTELAFLAPPTPKLKARFMNLGPLLAWARRVPGIVRQPPPSVLRTVTESRLKEKLGWVEGFAAEFTEWSQWQQVVDAAVTLANRQGVARDVPRLLARRIRQLQATSPDAARVPLVPSATRLAAELVRFARAQARQLKPGERLPGSTEVLESCFGKFKHLEKQQSRGGFTQLLLGFGALLAKLTPQAVRAAMQSSRTADVKQWLAQTLGLTVFAQRKLAFCGATEVR
jgi:hypothetical protein